MLSGKFLGRISVFDELPRYRGFGHPPAPNVPLLQKKKMITITPFMQAARPPFSPQSPRFCLTLRGGGGGGRRRDTAVIRDCADSFRVNEVHTAETKPSRPPRVRPLGSFLPPLPPGARRISVRAAILVVCSRTPTSYHLWSLIMLTIRRLRHQ